MKQINRNRVALRGRTTPAKSMTTIDLSYYWRSYDCSSNRYSTNHYSLFFEHGHLTLIVCCCATRPARRANHSEHGERLKRRARHEDALGVRALVRRVDQVTLRQILGEIGRH